MMRKVVAVAAALAAVALANAGRCGAEPLAVSDAISGGGGAGPYLLAWSAVEPGSELVSRNGMRLIRGIDYALNAAAGTIAFTQPLSRSDMAYVTYTRTPGATRRPPQTQELALSLASLRSGSGGVDLTARYRQGPAPTLVYGLDASTRAGQNAGVAASVLLSQAVGAQAGGPLALGWRTEGHARAGALNLTGSLAQAEEGFAQGSAWGLASGGTRAAVAAEYAPGTGLKFSTAQFFTTTAAGRAQGAAYGLDLSSSMAALSASRSEQVASESSSVVDRLQVSARPLRGVDVLATHLAQDSGGSQVTTDGMGVTVRPADSLTLMGGWTRERSAAEIEGRRAGMAWSPAPSLRLEGEYVQNPADGAGRLQVADVTRVGVAADLGSLGVKAGVSSRQDVSGVNQSRDVSLLLGLPGKSVLSAGWTQHDIFASALAADTTTYSLGYTLGPRKDLSLSLAGKWLLYDEALTASRDEQQLEAKLTARF